MKKASLFGCLLMALSVHGQSNQSDTLAWIGGEPVMADEFIAVYSKNKDIGKDIDPKTPREYLDLFINFKLKVHEAEEMGLDTSQAFLREFYSYRSQLAKPYLTKKEVGDELLKEAYARMEQEVNASHIMLDLPTDAIPEDTLKVYKKLMDIRKDIIDGKISFEDAAQQYSTDTYSAKRGGNLGYFTVFNMVYPFENAAYDTPVGSISKPVRTQFGYHIVKVLDKRPASGVITVAQIFVKGGGTNADANADNSSKVKIMEIYEKVKAGEDFGLLAKQFSDDPQSASNYGKMKPFGINTMMKEFEDAAFALQEIGDVSEPFQTQMGWHIVKLIDRKPIATFEEAKPQLLKKIESDSRSNRSKESFIADLKKEYGFESYPKNLKPFYKMVDKSYLEGTWSAPEGKKLNKVLFKFADQEVTQQDFLDYLVFNQKRGQKSATPEQEVYKQFNLFEEQTLMDYEDRHLESKYPEFRLLVNEYRDGILLFDLTEEKVWNAAVEDSVGVEMYYSHHADDYMWPERVDGAIFSAANKDMAKSVMKDVKKGMDGMDIFKKYNENSKLNVRVDEGFITKQEAPILNEVTWKKGLYGPIERDGRFFVIKINDVVAPTNKTLDEVRGLVISEYQKELEKEWIKDLRSKYEVKVNEKVFDESIQTLAD